MKRTDIGKTELGLSEDPDQFQRLAERVREKLGGKWIAKTDGFEHAYWDLEIEGTIITVHREHYLGVSVFWDQDPEKSEIREGLIRNLQSIC